MPAILLKVIKIIVKVWQYYNTAKESKLLKNCLVVIIILIFIAVLCSQTLLSMFLINPLDLFNAQKIDNLSNHLNYNFDYYVYNETSNIKHTYTGSYIHPTLGSISQGWLLGGSATKKEHYAFDIADSKDKTTEVLAFTNGTIKSIGDNTIKGTYKRWRFCDEGICWYTSDTKADIQYGCGNEIVIQHQDGLQTRYCHLERVYVKEGQSVSTGDIIGIQGSTGFSTGKHLHFQMEFQEPSTIRSNPILFVNPKYPFQIERYYINGVYDFFKWF